MGVIFVGDIGTELILDCGVSLATVDVAKIIAKTPRGVRKEWVATVVGPTTIRYTLQAGDIDYPGTWVIQSYVEMPSWRGRGQWAILKVDN